jgi:hypothetical protein
MGSPPYRGEIERLIALNAGNEMRGRDAWCVKRET